MNLTDIMLMKEDKTVYTERVCLQEQGEPLCGGEIRIVVTCGCATWARSRSEWWVCERTYRGTRQAVWLSLCLLLYLTDALGGEEGVKKHTHLDGAILSHLLN